MNIDDYRYIMTIAETGSFTQAAQKLFIAQPSLSQRVKHIEKSYGISIFNRETKGVHLTAEGECFLKYARDIVKSEEDLQRELSDMKNPEKQILRISASQLIQSFLLSSLIREFHKAYPGIQFAFSENISAADQQKMLLEGKTDIGILYLPIVSEDLQAQVIFEDSHVLVPASESSLEEKILKYSEENLNEPIPVGFLDGEPFAAASPGTKLNSYTMKLEEKYGVHPDIQHYGKSYSTLYMIASSGMASTILYESYFDPAQKYVPYYYLDDEGEEEDLKIGIAWRKKTFLSQAARAFIDFSREFSANLSDYTGEGK